MKHPFLTLLVIAFITGIVFLLFSLRLRPILPETSPENTAVITPLTTPTVTFVNPSHGFRSPLITIVEFSDFTCTYCKTQAAALDKLLLRYPLKIKIVWKHFPNDQHKLALPAAIAGQCANDQGKFWVYHDALFTKQNLLTSEEVLRSIASETGLNLSAFDSCYKNRDTWPIVEKDFNEALGLGLTATPTLFINNIKIEGLTSFEDLAAYVEKILQ